MYSLLTSTQEFADEANGSKASSGITEVNILADIDLIPFSITNNDVLITIPEFKSDVTLSTINNGGHLYLPLPFPQLAQ